MSQVIETNLADYWLALTAGPGSQIQTGRALRWVYGGSPYFNRVVLAHLDHANADSHIAEVARQFRRWQAAVTWLTGPTSTPDDLGERLQRNGFEHFEVWKGMALPLSPGSLTDLPQIPAGGLVYQVSEREAWRAWRHVICRSFNLPPHAGDVLITRLEHSASTGMGCWQHNLAYYRGAPVAASTLFISRGVAGVYLVATTPEARNRGYGTAMTSLALRQACERGCEFAVLHATEARIPIYEQLGFQRACEIGVYRLPAPAPRWRRLTGRMINQVRNTLL
jgi:GNAT superfamily N-acetyltransferase